VKEHRHEARVRWTGARVGTTSAYREHRMSGPRKRMRNFTSSRRARRRSSSTCCYVTNYAEAKAGVIEGIVARAATSRSSQEA
jgi:hypothetical protein